jgi:cell division protein FtsB
VRREQLQPRQQRKQRQQRKVKLALKQRLLVGGIAVLLLGLLFLPVQIRMWRMQGQLRELRQQQQELIAQRTQIQKKIDYYSSDAYVEEAARQQLGLVKPGESPIVPAVPGKTQKQSSSSVENIKD